jgi:cell wall assembly regulator SMI1
VLTSELMVVDRSLRAQIDVVYTLEPVLEMFVPREMREKYTLTDGSTIEGKATYARFRRIRSWWTRR